MPQVCLKLPQRICEGFIHLAWVQRGIATGSWIHSDLLLLETGSLKQNDIQENLLLKGRYNQNIQSKCHIIQIFIEKQIVKGSECYLGLQKCVSRQVQCAGLSTDFTWLCVGAVVTELTKIKKVNVRNWLQLTFVKCKQTLFYISSFTKCFLYVFSNRM